MSQTAHKSVSGWMSRDVDGNGSGTTDDEGSHYHSALNKQPTAALRCAASQFIALQLEDWQAVWVRKATRKLY